MKMKFLVFAVAALVMLNFSGFCLANQPVTAPTVTPPMTELGASQLVHVQGTVKTAGGGGIAVPGVTVTVIIYDPNIATGTYYDCGGVIYSQTFAGATDAYGRFSVLLGSSTPLYLKVNTNYKLQLWVGNAGGERIAFTGFADGCLPFEAFAGPGKSDTINGPININSTGTGLKINATKVGLSVASSGCSVSANFGQLVMTNSLWATSWGAAPDFYTTDLGLPAGRVTLGLLGNPSTVTSRVGIQTFAGEVTLTDPAGTEKRIDIDTSQFWQPLCNDVAAAVFTYYVTLTPMFAVSTASSPLAAPVRIVTKGTTYFTVTDGVTNPVSRKYSFVLVGGWKCDAGIIPNPAIALPPLCAD